MTAVEEPLYAEPWRKDAACAAPEVDASWFFPEKSDRPTEVRRKVDAAKACCASCPVSDDCLQFAIAHREQWGIYGGLTATERRPSRRNGAVGSRGICRRCGARFTRESKSERYCCDGCRRDAVLEAKRNWQRS